MVPRFRVRKLLHRAHDGAILIHVVIVMGDLGLKALYLLA
jgi:hypothetical protein